MFFSNIHIFEPLTLNLGCGTEKDGDVRADLIKSSSVNVVCDAENLPFRNNVFNVIVSNNLFEHLGNPLQSLRDQSRVLKCGGKIAVLTDNASYWRFHLMSKSAHINYVGRGKKDQHYSLFLPFHLKNFFREAGLTVTKIEYKGEKAFRITGAINFVLRTIPQLKHVSYGRFQIWGVKQ